MTINVVASELSIKTSSNRVPFFQLWEQMKNKAVIFICETAKVLLSR